VGSDWIGVLDGYLGRVWRAFAFVCGLFFVFGCYQTGWLEDVGLELELYLFSERELVVLVVAHAF
jgi:hypothetical protein